MSTNLFCLSCVRGLAICLLSILSLSASADAYREYCDAVIDGDAGATMAAMDKIDPDELEAVIQRCYKEMAGEEDGSTPSPDPVSPTSGDTDPAGVEDNPSSVDAAPTDPPSSADSDEGFYVDASACGQAIEAQSSRVTVQCGHPDQVGTTPQGSCYGERRIIKLSNTCSSDIDFCYRFGLSGYLIRTTVPAGSTREIKCEVPYDSRCKSSMSGEFVPKGAKCLSN